MDLNKLILELRAKSGAGISDCKKALTETNGNFEEALTVLRKKGLSDAAKKSGRATKEGAVAYAVSGKSGALIELNSETDFVARTAEFQALAQNLADKFASGEMKDIAQASSLIQPVFQKLGENIQLRRFEHFSLKGHGLISGYIHLGAKKGALIEISTSTEKAAASEELLSLSKELLLQIVGSSSKYLSKTDVSQAEIEKEKEIYTELLKKEGKPEASIPKIVEGKINKLFYQSLCLLEQLSIRDNKTPVSQMIKETATKLGAEISVVRFARYQLGE